MEDCTTTRSCVEGLRYHAALGACLVDTIMLLLRFQAFMHGQLDLRACIVTGWLAPCLTQLRLQDKEAAGTYWNQALQCLQKTGPDNSIALGIVE